MAAVPSFTGSASVQPDGTQITAANNISQGAQINNTLLQGAGQLNSEYKNETVPQENSAAGAAGQWYSSARKVAQGNASRHFLDDQYDMISSANNALSTMYQNQAQAAIGLVLP